MNVAMVCRGTREKKGKKSVCSKTRTTTHLNVRSMGNGRNLTPTESCSGWHWCDIKFSFVHSSVSVEYKHLLSSASSAVPFRVATTNTRTVTYGVKTRQLNAEAKKKLKVSSHIHFVINFLAIDFTLFSLSLSPSSPPCHTAPHFSPRSGRCTVCHVYIM